MVFNKWNLVVKFSIVYDQGPHYYSVPRSRCRMQPLDIHTCLEVFILCALAGLACVQFIILAFTTPADILQ